jgi:hypothetical protein
LKEGCQTKNVDIDENTSLLFFLKLRGEKEDGSATDGRLIASAVKIESSRLIEN